MEHEEIGRKLQAWLVDECVLGHRVANLRQLSGGFSQLMYAFDLHSAEGTESLVLRASRPKGQSITATDRLTEWQVVDSLSKRGGVPLPRGIVFDDGQALGVECFIVEHVDGTTISKHFAVTPDAPKGSVADMLVDCLASIHAVPTSELPQALARPASWESHLDALVRRWRELERTSLEPDPFVRYLANWLEANKPAPAPLCLVHGEVNNDNLLIKPDGSISVVDWEFAHIGDPREDLGWYRSVSESVPPDVMADDIERACHRYRQTTGLSEEIINPASVAYFGLLSGVGVYGTLVGAPAGVEASEQAPVLAAYMSAVLSSAHLAWLTAIDGLGRVTSAAPPAAGPDTTAC